MEASDLIGAAEAAKALGRTRRQVLNLIKDGLLPAQRAGSTHVIRRSDLAKVPRNRRPGPKPKKKKGR